MTRPVTPAALRLSIRSVRGPLVTAGEIGRLDLALSGPAKAVALRCGSGSGIFDGMRRTLFWLGALVLLTGCSVPRWPVDGNLTSPFGVRRDGLSFQVHRGVDISVPMGTAVRAMAPGKVAFAGAMRGYGRVVVVDHGGGVRTVYAHLSEIQVTKGQELPGRPIIGLSGASGRTSGPHLHFEIQRRGTAEDPVPLLGGFPGARGS